MSDALEAVRASRRDYYARNRERILAANKRSRERRGHLWKSARKGAVKRKRTPFRLYTCELRCRECNQLMYETTSTRFGSRHKGGEYRLCLECHPPHPSDPFVPKPPRHKAHRAGYLRHHHIFDYDECLEPQEPEPPIDPEIDERNQVALAVVNALEDKPKWLLVERFINNRTLEEIGQQRGRTRERIRQRIIDVLRHVHFEMGRRKRVAEMLGKSPLDVNWSDLWSEFKQPTYEI